MLCISFVWEMVSEVVCQEAMGVVLALPSLKNYLPVWLLTDSMRIAVLYCLVCEQTGENEICPWDLFLFPPFLRYYCVDSSPEQANFLFPQGCTYITSTFQKVAVVGDYFHKLKNS